jgi:copper oxidase (laccase) domain-containing protein
MDKIERNIKKKVGIGKKKIKIKSRIKFKKVSKLRNQCKNMKFQLNKMESTRQNEVVSCFNLKKKLKKKKQMHHNDIILVHCFK